MSTPGSMVEKQGSVPRPTLKTWVMAIRPKTLTAAVVPVAVGTALAFRDGTARFGPAVAALFGAVLIQIGTNLVNDYYDFKKGADTAERLGPVRVTQSGLIAPSTVIAAGLLSFLAAIMIGLYLIAVGGWPIVIIGGLSVLSGYAYTAGPYPLGYNGLGDLFVMVFFGLVAVTGTYYVQALHVAPAAWLAAFPVGALATAILMVNNLRDVSTDAKVGKRTLVVRLGVRAGRLMYGGLMAMTFLTPIVMWLSGVARPGCLLALLALPVAIPPLRLVFNEQGAALNPALGGTARLQAAFGLLFVIGVLL